MTGSIQPTSPGQGIIYSLPLGPQRPSAEDLETVFTYLEPAAGPDGIAFGVSGKLYVALAGSNQVSILDPDGTEAARFPSAVDNALSPAPYDLPASVAFDGKGSLLVTNQSYFVANADNWVVLDVWVDDVELPLIRPSLP
jgi:DNA-binding beta-propeller fold protein YncE